MQSYMTLFVAMMAMSLVLGALELPFRAFKSLAPSLCDLPLASLFPRCHIAADSGASSPLPALVRADFPRLVRIQDAVLDDLLSQSLRGADFSVNVKHAELAVTDLVAVVRASNLTVKETLADALVDFANDARNAARALQRFSGKVQSVVDR